MKITRSNIYFYTKSKKQQKNSNGPNKMATIKINVVCCQSKGEKKDWEKKFLFELMAYVITLDWLITYNRLPFVFTCCFDYMFCSLFCTMSRFPVVWSRSSSSVRTNDDVKLTDSHWPT